MSGLVTGHYCVGRNQIEMSEVVPLRMNASTRLRVLAMLVRGRLMDTVATTLPEWALQATGSVLEVDDRALVLASEESDDLHFVLNMNGTATVLFFSSDIDAVAEIVAGYVIRREAGDEELARHLK